MRTRIICKFLTAHSLHKMSTTKSSGSTTSVASVDAGAGGAESAESAPDARLMDAGNAGESSTVSSSATSNAAVDGDTATMIIGSGEERNDAGALPSLPMSRKRGNSECATPLVTKKRRLTKSEQRALRRTLNVYIYYVAELKAKLEQQEKSFDDMCKRYEHHVDDVEKRFSSHSSDEVAIKEARDDLQSDRQERNAEFCQIHNSLSHINDTLSNLFELLPPAMRR